jgi:aminoglycoside phosphotransferase (APT) family kinase protein
MGREGVRSAWADVPSSVRHAVDAVLGSPVVSTSGVSGGFSPGPAVRADLADGRTVFVKAAGTALNPHSPGMHRREGEVLGVLPPTVPAPRLLGLVDDGDWVALAIEWVDGRTPSATEADDVERLLGVLDRVAAATAGADLPGIAAFADVHRSLLGHWVRLAVDPLPGLDAWSTRHLERLAELDALAPAATAGSHLVHVDTRTDNVLLADSGPDGDVVVDWPGAALGAPWIDLVGLLPALHLDGGPPPGEVFAAHATARQADPGAVDVFVAALAGYFTRQSLLPAPPGLPTLRAFQAAQGAIARRWLAERLRLP